MLLYLPYKEYHITENLIYHIRRCLKLRQQNGGLILLG